MRLAAADRLSAAAGLRAAAGRPGRAIPRRRDPAPAETLDPAGRRAPWRRTAQTAEGIRQRLVRPGGSSMPPIRPASGRARPQNPTAAPKGRGMPGHLSLLSFNRATWRPPCVTLTVIPAQAAGIPARLGHAERVRAWMPTFV